MEIIVVHKEEVCRCRQYCFVKDHFEHVLEDSGNLWYVVNLSKKRKEKPKHMHALQDKSCGISLLPSHLTGYRERGKS